MLLRWCNLFKANLGEDEMEWDDHHDDQDDDDRNLLLHDVETENSGCGFGSGTPRNSLWYTHT